MKVIIERALSSAVLPSLMFAKVSNSFTASSQVRGRKGIRAFLRCPFGNLRRWGPRKHLGSGFRNDAQTKVTFNSWGLEFQDRGSLHLLWGSSRALLMSSMIFATVEASYREWSFRGLVFVEWAQQLVSSDLSGVTRWRISSLCSRGSKRSNWEAHRFFMAVRREVDNNLALPKCFNKLTELDPNKLRLSTRNVSRQSSGRLRGRSLRRAWRRLKKLE